MLHLVKGVGTQDETDTKTAQDILKPNLSILHAASAEN